MGFGFIGDLWDDLTGQSAVDAQAEASRDQVNMGNRALELTAQSNRDAIAESQRQYDHNVNLRERDINRLSPFINQADGVINSLLRIGDYGDDSRNILQRLSTIGSEAAETEARLLGLRGNDAMNEEIDIIQNSPGYTVARDQAEEAILQNAAATGGVRGGNTKRLLGEFRPGFLNQMINQKLNRLGNVTTRGGNVSQFLSNSSQGSLGDLARLSQSSVLGSPSASGFNPSAVQLINQGGQDQGNILQQIGTYQAGGHLGAANARQQGLSNLLNLGALGVSAGRSGMFNKGFNAIKGLF